MGVGNHDLLDGAIRRELEGEPLNADEWEGLLDELSEEPEPGEVSGGPIDFSGDDVDDVCLRFRQECREKLGSTVARQIFQACRLLDTEPTRENLLLVCRLLNGVDSLPESDFSSGADHRAWLRGRLQAAWVDYMELTDRRALQQRFQELLPELRAPLPDTTDNCDTELLADTVRRVLGAKAMTGAMVRNLTLLRGQAERSLALHRVLPLFLYQMLVHHRSRLMRDEDIRFRMDVLWKYKKYTVDRDNGKNFQQYQGYIRLFKALCGLYSDDTAVDLPLCREGFAMLSNLPEFYYCEISGDGSPFPKPVELWVEDHDFTCFPLGLDDSVLFRRYALKASEMDRFQSAPHRQRELRRLSVEINGRASELLSSAEAGEDMETICDRVLSAAGVHLTGEAERRMALCAVKTGIMELTDAFALKAVTAALSGYIEKIDKQEGRITIGH